MVNTTRTPAASSASSGLPQDPMAIDPNVCVPATIGISTNLTGVANPTISVDTTNMATMTGQVDTTNLVALNEQPLPCREDLPLVPRTEGMVNVEQPPGTTPGFGPRYYVGETRPGIRKPTIGKPYVPQNKPIQKVPLLLWHVY
uniref:Uncharacterized protein n=1 Tax=Cannabis sativa TaxID=3483 RepID=A0A803QIW1_CANSA